MSDILETLAEAFDPNHRTDLTKIADALDAEAEFWVDAPTGRPGQLGYLFPPLLMSLARRIREADHA